MHRRTGLSGFLSEGLTSACDCCPLAVVAVDALRFGQTLFLPYQRQAERLGPSVRDRQKRNDRSIWTFSERQNPHSRY